MCIPVYVYYGNIISSRAGRGPSPVCRPRKWVMGDFFEGRSPHLRKVPHSNTNIEKVAIRIRKSPFEFEGHSLPHSNTGPRAFSMVYREPRRGVERI